MDTNLEWYKNYGYKSEQAIMKIPMFLNTLDIMYGNS